MHSQDHLQSPRAILPKWCEPTEKARAVQIVRKLIKLLMLVCPLVYCRCNRCALCAAQNKLNTFTVFGAKNRWRHISLGKSNLNLKSHPSKDKFPKPDYRVATVTCKAVELDLVWGWRDIDKVKQKGFQLLQRLTWGEDSNPCNNKITLL